MLVNVVASIKESINRAKKVPAFREHTLLAGDALPKRYGQWTFEVRKEISGQGGPKEDDRNNSSKVTLHTSEPQPGSPSFMFCFGFFFILFLLLCFLRKFSLLFSTYLKSNTSFEAHFN